MYLFDCKENFCKKENIRTFALDSYTLIANQ